MPTTKTPASTGLFLSDVAAQVTIPVDGDQINCNAIVGQTPLYSTTIAAGSDTAVLPQGTIYLASTTGMPISGVIWIGILATQIAYTGLTSGATPTITGCTGGSGTLALGQVVTQGNPNLSLLRVSNLLVVLLNAILAALSQLTGVAYLAVAQSWSALQSFGQGIATNTGSGKQGIVVNADATTGGGPAVGITQTGTGAALGIGQLGTGPAMQVASGTNTSALVQFVQSTGSGDCLEVGVAAPLANAIKITEGLIQMSATQPALADAVPANAFGAERICKAYGVVELTGGGVTLLDGSNLAAAPSIGPGRAGGASTTGCVVVFETPMANTTAGNDYSVSFGVMAPSGAGAAIFSPFLVSQTYEGFTFGATSDNGANDKDLSGTVNQTFSFQVFGRQTP